MKFSNTQTHELTTYINKIPYLRQITKMKVVKAHTNLVMKYGKIQQRIDLSFQFVRILDPSCLKFYKILAK